MWLSRSRSSKWLRRLAVGFVILGVSMVLSVIGARPANSASTSSCGADQMLVIPPPNVGSIAEYIDKNHIEPPPSCASLVGINVFEGQGTLASGQKLSGVGVISVDRPSAADEAGIRAERLPPMAAAAELGVGVLVIGALLAFPPAFFAVGLVPKTPDHKAYDVIIAVDADRTRNLGDLETSLRKAVAGETIYLTVIRDGQRKQLQVIAPTSFAATQ